MNRCHSGFETIYESVLRSAVETDVMLKDTNLKSNRIAYLIAQLEHVDEETIIVVKLLRERSFEQYNSNSYVTHT